MSHFIVGRKIEIGGIFAGAGGGIDIDFQLDADRPGLACPGKDKVELAGDRIILEDRLPDRAVPFRLGPRAELRAELAAHVAPNRERRPRTERAGQPPGWDSVAPNWKVSVERVSHKKEKEEHN